VADAAQASDATPADTYIYCSDSNRLTASAECEYLVNYLSSGGQNFLPDDGFFLLRSAASAAFGRTSLRGMAVAVLTLLSFVSVGYAQLPNGNVFIGYAYSSDIGSGPHHDLNGWNGSLEGKLFPWVGIVTEVSGLYGRGDPVVNTRCTSPIGAGCSSFRAHADLHNVLFGPRVSLPVGRLTPFAHALFGVSHASETAPGFSDSFTAFGKAFGGGFDYRLVHGIGWRFQADDLQTSWFGTTQNNIRFSTGVVFHF
jgi:hypothetical protein